MTTSCSLARATNSSPLARPLPWCTSTRKLGEKRASSRCQLPTTEVGQMSSTGLFPAPRSLS